MRPEPTSTPMVAAIASPPLELLEAMQRHGVVPPLTVYIER